MRHDGLTPYDLVSAVTCVLNSSPEAGYGLVIQPPLHARAEGGLPRAAGVNVRTSSFPNVTDVGHTRTPKGDGTG